MATENFQNEIKKGERFKFGENWKNFLNHLNDERIKQAENSLKEMLDVTDLTGKSFLDIGSGSGLFSLAAKNLGANVTSFDYDVSSVNCTKELKKRYHPNCSNWDISQGSILDQDFISEFEKFDYVYSWGVLHHTGNMWQALDNVHNLVKDDGVLFIALYNDQNFISRYWSFVKKTYNRFPMTRPIWITIHSIYPTLPSLIKKTLSQKKPPRGMTIWYDLIDWLGGYPFEVSTPNEIFNFYKTKGFKLEQIITVGGKMGCNEFVFRRLS